MHLRIVDNLAFYHGLCVHQPCSQGFFPNAERLIGVLLQPITLRRKEALGTRLNGHALLLDFQTQQEKTVLIC